MCCTANITYGQMTGNRAASFQLGTASSSLVRTTSAYRIQVEADWQGTNVSIPVCGESTPHTIPLLLLAN